MGVRLENARLGFQLVTAFLCFNRPILLVRRYSSTEELNLNDQGFISLSNYKLGSNFYSEMSTHVHLTLSRAQINISLRVKSLSKFIEP